MIFFFGFFFEVGKEFVIFFELFKVFFFGRSVGEDIGNERLGRDGSVVFGESGNGGNELGEDGEFLGDVNIGEVILRVRFLYM